jgi:hypothetical protein
MTDADSLAELAAKVKQPTALFIIELPLRDVEMTEADENNPACSFQGMGLEPATGIDYQTVSWYYTEKKRGD